jgi:hypothetical protein
VRIRRPFRLLGLLAMVAAALGYVVFSATHQAMSRQSVVSSLVRRLVSAPEPYATGTSAVMGATRSNAGWTVTDLSAERSAGFGASVLFDLHIKQDRWGIWHSVVVDESVGYGFMSGPMDNGPPLDSVAAQTMFRQFHQAKPHVLSRELLDAHANGRSLRRILWLGVLGDLSILTAFAVILYSLVKLRRECRWKRGLCTTCDYDLAGITVHKCPECGTVVRHGLQS